MSIEKFENLKIEPMFFKFLSETHSLSKTMDLMKEWTKKNYVEQGCICTNNEYEAELEKEWIEDRMKMYGEIKNEKQ